MIFLSLLGGALTTWDLVKRLLPPPVPVIVTEVSDRITPDGYWRVEGRGIRTEVCALRVYVRRFRDLEAKYGGSREYQRGPDRVSDPRIAGPIFEGIIDEGAELRFWEEFKVIPGRRGVYTVALFAAGCPSGYRDASIILERRYNWLEIAP